MKFKATLRYMAASEIASMIPPAKMAEIKMKDARPLFKVFVVGHEGEATGNLLGVGNIIKRWYKNAIEKLHQKINAGLQLFSGHGETNDQAGRMPVGEVVGKKPLSIKDRLSSVVACWIYPSFRNLPFDVASIEAGVDIQEDKKAGLYVADVGSVSVIALGNSLSETPGFAGATLLGQLQAFAETHKIHYTGGNQTMSLEEIRQAIQEGKLRPSDIFDPETLSADPVVSERTQEKIRNARGFDMRKFDDAVAQRQELEKKLEAEKKTAKEKDDAIQKLNLEIAGSKVPGLFETRKKDRKLDEKQVKFIESRLPSFKPDKAEDVDKQFDKFLDGEIVTYGKIAKDVFGLEVAAPGNGEDGKETKPVGAEPEDAATKQKSKPANKYLDPAQNPMIKLD